MRRVRRAVLSAALVLVSLAPAAAAPAKSNAPAAPTVVEVAIGLPASLDVRPSAHASKPAWTETIEAPGASFVAVHVARLALGPGEVLVVSDRDGRVAHRYEGRGPREDGGAFWALSVAGDFARLSLFAAPAAPGPNAATRVVSIDRVSYGPPLAPEIDAVCGPDDARDAICEREAFPDEYERSRAVVRLLVGGTKLCTGFLSSCANHVITSAQCVASQAELDQTEIQFGFERSACGSGSATPALQTQGGTLFDAEPALDYAVFVPALLPGADPRSTFGYIKLEPRVPALDETIYVPGHPAGAPLQIALRSTHPSDQSGRCEIASIDEPACTGTFGDDLGYYCDTEGGSQGSPVIAARSHGAIALHHCANCPNRGVPMGPIVASIASRTSGLPACATCVPGGPATGVAVAADGANRIRVSWSAQPGASFYRVYRSRGGCGGGGFERIAEARGTSFVDEGASTGVVYGYRVTAVDDDGCEGERSSCASASTTGACLEAPVFAGLTSAADAASASCGVSLAWAAATSRCAGGTLRYSVYRSAVPGFEPTPAQRIASCLTATSYTDAKVSDGTTYFYVVRAEDLAGEGSGACGGGAEDANRASRSAVPEGPESVYFADDFESGFGWTLDGEWEIGSPVGFGGTLDGGSGGADPPFSSDGLGALGVDLSGLGSFAGNYEDRIATPEYATSPAFSATGRSQAILRFDRWLCVERSRYDRAFVEAWDGTLWVRLWTNPDVSITESSWSTQEIDASAAIAGRADAQVRFGIESDGDVRYCGWNIDELEVYERATCASGALGTRPVPDGKFTGGTAMRASRGAAATVSVTFDTTLCSSPAYHLLYGDVATLPSGGTIAGAACSLSPSGVASAPVPDPPAGSARFFVIVGASGATESHHGYDARGVRRTSAGAGFCGIAAQDQSAVCP